MPIKVKCKNNSAIAIHLLKIQIISIYPIGTQIDSRITFHNINSNKRGQYLT